MIMKFCGFIGKFVWNGRDVQIHCQRKEAAACTCRETKHSRKWSSWHFQRRQCTQCCMRWCQRYRPPCWTVPLASHSSHPLTISSTRVSICLLVLNPKASSAPSCPASSSSSMTPNKTSSVLRPPLLWTVRHLIFNISQHGYMTILEILNKSNKL